jgi:hypothetical protein
MKTKDGGVNSRVPTRLELPYIRPLGDFSFIVGCKIPPIFICVAFPEVRRLVIIWSVVVVEQFESRKAALYVGDQLSLTSDREKPRTWELIHLTRCVNQPPSKRLGNGI